MSETRERQALRRIIDMVFQGKTITIEPDFGMPFTIYIGSEDDGTCMHTHCPVMIEERDEESIRKIVDSLVTCILGDGPGLSWAASVADAPGKQPEDLTSERFDTLRDMALVAWPQATRWCVKEQKSLLLSDLSGKRCIKCKHFIFNGGDCDPL